MGEYAPIIIALAIIVLIVLVIHLGVSYAFQIYENRRLQEEINKGFHYTIGFNQSLAKDVKFLEDELRPYRRLANKYGCGDEMELEELIMNLQCGLYRKDVLAKLEEQESEIAELKAQAAQAEDDVAFWKAKAKGEM